MFFQGERGGQAALMDSIIFLTIIASVATMLFFFMISYGEKVDTQLDSFYSEDFAIDTLKVITYINVMRDGRSVFEFDSVEGEPEYDYLLAMMKEDYADKGKFSVPTKKAIVSTISSTLRPFDPSLDYAFYIFNEDSDDFVFLLLATHEGEINEDEFNVERKYYECDPSDTELLTRKVFPYVGEMNSAGGKIFMGAPNEEPSLDEPGEGASTPYIISLNMWVSKDIAVLNDMDDPSDSVSDLNCTEVTDDWA